MNSYFALIYSNKLLKSTLRDYRFVKALTHQKNIIELFFQNNETMCKMIVSVMPHSPVFFTDSRINEKSLNTVSFFEALNGSYFNDSYVADGDRYVTLKFENDFKLILQLFGPRPNVFLIKNDTIIEAFKSPSDWEGKPQPEPQKPEIKCFEDTKGPIKQRIFKSYPYLQRSFIPNLIFYGKLEGKKDNEVASYLSEVQRTLETKTEFRKMRDGRFCLIPSIFIPDKEAEVFSSINEAIRVTFFSERSNQNFLTLREAIVKRLKKERTRYENLISASDESIKSLERAETYSKYADILMAHAHQKREDREELVTFNDIYEPNNRIEIRLKPEASYAENATMYYEKKKKSERSFEILNEQAIIAVNKLEQISGLENEILKINRFYELKEFLKKQKDNEFLRGASEADELKSRPYLILSNGKYEIWIGKNAKGNDELLRDAHKEDIWLHARGVSGSHVIIRMQKRTQDPDASVLELAASWAAWKSKARGAALVPVIWTRKKFVRKPKGAAPGTVIVQQEKVILVQPSDVKSEYFKS